MRAFHHAFDYDFNICIDANSLTHNLLLSNYPNYAAPNHWHDDIELIAVLDGEMKYNVNGEIINLINGNGTGRKNIGTNSFHVHKERPENHTS